MPSTLQIIRDEHTALSAMLRSLVMMEEKGPGDEPERYFDVLRAMLFYIDEFPERMHHPKETDLLFPKVLKAQPALANVIRRLDNEHHAGENRVRELQHMLLAWELLGEPRRPAFSSGLKEYVRFYLEHMKVEELEILPAAEASLSAADWAEIDAAFERDRDPLAGGERHPAFDRLFTRIVMKAPAPIGVGPAY
jgi:hemerythrin-like domain-containing protein